uniref:Lipocalin n=1 Tax=Rhipicephalus appendiculatus TaxID=34631 RepID=A0A131Z4R7_RHIAP
MKTGSDFVVLLVTICSLTGSSQSIFIKENEFKAFLNTPQPIWTLNTTNKYNKNFCIVDIKQHMLKEKIMYRHTFYVDYSRRQRVSVQMEGTFKYSDNMVASPKGSKVVFKHHLVYLDEDNFCAVIKVSPKLPSRGQSWHDLRMWNSTFAKYRRPSITCAHYFNLAAKHGRQTYLPICQKILFQVNPWQQKNVQEHKTYRNTSV